MYSDLSTTHRLYANCIMAGINPDDLTEDWVQATTDSTIQADLETLLQSALNAWVADTLT